MAWTKGKQQTKKKGKKFEPGIHPWDRWFKRKSFRLLRGRDYKCQPHSMMVQIRTQALRRGLKVMVGVDEKLITVEVVKKKKKGKK